MRTAGSLAVASLTGLLAAAAPAKDYSYADLLRKMTDLADLATVHDIHVLRKPVRPAALRAAMSHLEIRAVAGG